MLFIKFSKFFRATREISHLDQPWPAETGDVRQRLALPCCLRWLREVCVQIGGWLGECPAGGWGCAERRGGELLRRRCELIFFEIKPVFFSIRSTMVKQDVSFWFILLLKKRVLPSEIQKLLVPQKKTPNSPRTRRARRKKTFLPRTRCWKTSRLSSPEVHRPEFHGWFWDATKQQVLFW